MAGDFRAMVQPTLLSMHNLFLLEHNRIAEGIRRELAGRLLAAGMSPLEEDEVLFQVKTYFELLFF